MGENASDCCFHPSDERRPIDRIEVVRTRPRASPDERIEDLIEDPWRVFPCPADGSGCRVSFVDESYPSAGRDSVYYARVHQRATPTINGGNLRCWRDQEGRCVDVKPCRAGDPTAPDDDCLASVEERAWSSPIFVDYR